MFLMYLLLFQLRNKTNRTNVTRTQDEKSQEEVPQDANTEAADSSSDSQVQELEDSSGDSIYDNFELYRM